MKGLSHGLMAPYIHTGGEGMDVVDYMSNVHISCEFEGITNFRQLSCRLNCRKETNLSDDRFCAATTTLFCKDCSQIRKFCVREHHPR